MIAVSLEMSDEPKNNGFLSKTKQKCNFYNKIFAQFGNII